ncbi:MAG: DUF4091 domain-containing protein [Myxococcota bacterium]
MSATFLSFAVLLGATATHRAEPKPWAGAVSALEKIRPGQVPSGSTSAKLLVARQECEAVQLAVPPPAQKVDARLEALTGPGPAMLARLYRVGYVPVEVPSNAEGAPGLWPDPLIPAIDAYTQERRAALPHDSTQERPLVLYLELCVPATQKPGLYRGAVVLTAKGRRAQRIELAAQVLPFTLPATSSLPNSFGISIYSLAHGHEVDGTSDQARVLLRRYATSLLTHRLSAYGMGIEPPEVSFEGGQLRVDFTAYDAEMAPFLEGTALPSGARFTTSDVRDSPQAKTEEEKVAYYRAFQQHFQEKGWKARLFFYAKDEPAPEDYPLVKRQAARVRRAGGIDVLVTTGLDEELKDAADILCPTLNCFFPRTGLATCPRVTAPHELRARLGHGRRVWWYQSCNAHGCDLGPVEDLEVERAYSRWASYMVDHSAARNRAMGPLAFLAGVDGELYFDTVYQFHESDPWEGVLSFGGNGDGTLFYPGTPDRIGGQTPIPIESLRLKHIRDGLEDFEWLSLAQRRGASSLARASVRRLVRSGYDITDSPREWQAVRERLAAYLSDEMATSE